MRRQDADREEKRVTHGNDDKKRKDLDLTSPNQRGLSYLLSLFVQLTVILDSYLGRTLIFAIPIYWGYRN